jgi:hypothetical protein
MINFNLPSHGKKDIAFENIMSSYFFSFVTLDAQMFGCTTDLVICPKWKSMAAETTF